MVDKTKDSTDWFIGKARSASGYRKNIASNAERARDSATIGKMYFFYYDPKTKDKLPVYDRFPLVFPIERYSDGFLGLNLHYLAGSERTYLLNKLMEFKSSAKLTETTRLRLSYDLLAGAKKIKGVMGPCVKRYLFDHVRSKFIEVPANEWEKVINLPVELFVRKK